MVLHHVYFTQPLSYVWALPQGCPVIVKYTAAMIAFVHMNFGSINKCGIAELKGKHISNSDTFY